MAPEPTSQSTRTPAWPENPPAWPENPPAWPETPPAPSSSASVFEPSANGSRARAEQRRGDAAAYPQQPPSAPFAADPARPGQHAAPPAGHQRHPEPEVQRYADPGPDSHQSAARTTGPQQYMPSATGPQRYTPADSAPQRYTPADSGPQRYTPADSAPQRYGPADSGPQRYTPSGAGPQRQSAEPAGPRRYTPADSGPQRYDADGGPQAYAPSGPGSQQHTASAAAPPHAPTGPQHTSAPGQQTPADAGPASARDPRQRQPHDPYKPFVTAGQISGPKTPPPERQQQLWNTVFGDNYEAIGEEADAEAAGGRRAWLLALVASMVVALIAALLWAFLAGPLRPSPGEGETSANAGPTAPAASRKPPATTKPQSVGRLPKYPGQASPRTGTLTDEAASVSVARLGGPWRLDLRSQLVKAEYGFATRQYVPAGQDSAGNPQFAQVMTGPLSEGLAEKYSASEPEKLAPVISAVAFAARNKFFPEGNKVAKIAEQRVSVGGRPARLAAYQVTAGDAKTTMVVAAVSTGGDVPAIVYMSVPERSKRLLPDVNTVFTSIRSTGS
ncbi:hypothetical protein [Sphaerisporangium sp. TRM90804]|uniref:hypothetical protein n=1 Tax=Sphaerisporangium sp. TRM90804 TaxID=3031113 RepID=UPI00244681BA|nr:hypothetical protein [Sphaerisporangium sp. TRM90804]MDH2428205.1 hypothetical protein [Sphaerisporangium sp. TRM90804]